MAHELEFIDGQASFAGRSPAWHQLGTVIEDLTYAQAMDEAHLAGWNVRTEPLVVVTSAGADNKYHQITDQQLVVRDHPDDQSDDVLAIVGGKYNAIQNEQAFALAPHLESMGAEVETAGAIREGRQVFLSLALPNHIVIDPDGANDHVNGYLLLTTSHDGSLAVEAANTWVRVVCANTLDFALPNAKRSYKVRHTQNAADRLAAAQAVMLEAAGYGKRLQAEANALYQTHMDNAGFVKVAKALFPEPDTDHKPAVARWENKIDFLGGLFNGGAVDADDKPVQFSNANIRNTAWAGLNALTEYQDWHRTARGGDNTSLLIDAAGFGYSNFKAKARKAVLSWASEQDGSPVKALV